MKNCCWTPFRLFRTFRLFIFKNKNDKRAKNPQHVLGKVFLISFLCLQTWMKLWLVLLVCASSAPPNFDYSFANSFRHAWIENDTLYDLKLFLFFQQQFTLANDIKCQLISRHRFNILLNYNLLNYLSKEIFLSYNRMCNVMLLILWPIANEKKGLYFNVLENSVTLIYRNVRIIIRQYSISKQINEIL